MTTTVMIATQGNKEVELDTPNGRMVLPPGRWGTFSIHGEQTIVIKETGDFVAVSQGLRHEPLAKKTEG